MSKIAASSGGAGDIVYSIPVLRKLGVTTVYVKENYYRTPGLSLYTSIKPLLESQGFAVLPTSGAYSVGQFEPGLQYNYNLDNFRNQPYRGKNHIILSYHAEFGFPCEGWTRPWLENIRKAVFCPLPYALIHLTPRWRDNSKVDWKKVRAGISLPCYFIGLEEEWKTFCQRYGEIVHLRTINMLEMAALIQGCEALYCNQSVALTIAQGLGKPYYLERKPGKTNTLMYTKNEHLL